MHCIITPHHPDSSRLLTDDVRGAPSLRSYTVSRLAEPRLRGSLSNRQPGGAENGLVIGCFQLTVSNPRSYEARFDLSEQTFRRYSAKTEYYCT